MKSWRTKTTRFLSVLTCPLYLEQLRRPDAILAASSSCFGKWLRNAREIYVNRFDLPGRHTSVPRLL